MVIVAWDKTCRPHKEGGLGIRSLPTLNEASNLKMWWDMLKSKEECALILRKRADTISLIGNGDVTNFWLDKWCGEQSFVELLSILSAQHQSHSDRIDMFIQNHQWMIPQEIANHFPAMRFLIGRVVIPLEDKPNNLIWIGIDFGNLSLKEAFSFKTKEVLWVPPIGNWVKANTDEASNSTTSTCGWLFRNHQDEFIGGFAENLGSHNAFYTEMSRVFKAIELAH
ncbi:hypothetical protein KIW84_024823 [Lathyrus oleraceus]|uniref:Uncharacterized protein n=1 Tax=Pisum sativum TaxID=3888 RepID=A0A9D4YL40_PEA|nr:hypothetical protein KIW84_024823 [Pisum sativum]